MCKTRSLLLHTHEIFLKPEGELHCISTQDMCETAESPPIMWLFVERWTSASCKTTMAFQDSARVKESRRSFSKSFALALISAIETGSKGRLADSAAHSTQRQLPPIKLLKAHTRRKCLSNPRLSIKQDHERAFLPSSGVSS